jgi:hypothetical protein
MKNAHIIIILFFSISSCTDNNLGMLNGILTGSFVEITPENNRTTLIFSTNSNQLEEKRISDGDNSVSRTFSILLLENNKIQLSRNEADEIAPRILHYLILDDNSFEIGNLNRDDPENTIMTFKRN